MTTRKVTLEQFYKNQLAKKNDNFTYYSPREIQSALEDIYKDEIDFYSWLVAYVESYFSRGNVRKVNFQEAIDSYENYCEKRPGPGEGCMERSVALEYLQTLGFVQDDQPSPRRRRYELPTTKQPLRDDFRYLDTNIQRFERNLPNLDTVEQNSSARVWQSLDTALDKSSPSLRSNKFQKKRTEAVIKSQNLRRELESKRIEAREKEEQLKKAREEQAKTRGALDSLMDFATPIIQESLFGKESQREKPTEEKFRKTFPRKVENAEILSGPTNTDLSKLPGPRGQAIRDWSDNVKSLIRSNEQKINSQLRDIEKLEQDLDELQSTVEQLRLEKKTLKTDLDNCLVGSANILSQLDLMEFSPEEAEEFIKDIAGIIGNVEYERREFTEREMRPYIQEFEAALEELTKISQPESAKRVTRRVGRAGKNVVEQHQLYNRHGLQATGRNIDLMGDGKVVPDRRDAVEIKREKERLKAEKVDKGVEISPRKEGEKQESGFLDKILNAIIPPAPPPLPKTEKENGQREEPEKQTSLFDELVKEGAKILKPVEKEKVTEKAPNVENTLMSELWTKISSLRSSISDEDDF